MFKFLDSDNEIVSQRESTRDNLALMRVLRTDILQSTDTVDRVSDRDRDSVVNGLGTRAGVHRRNGYLGRRDRRIFRDRQGRNRDETTDEDNQRTDGRENRAPQKYVGQFNSLPGICAPEPA